MTGRANPVGWFVVVFFLLGGIGFTITIPEIFIGQIWIAVSLFVAAVYLLIARGAKKAERMKLKGLPGEATILGMTQTGVYVNQQPQVKFKLRIEAKGVAPYEVDKSAVVPMVALGALSTGRPLTVYIDREDHKQFVIDWGAAVAPMTLQRTGVAPVGLGSDPATAQEVRRILDRHGIKAAGQVDLRQNQAARQEVLEMLSRQGVDAAHERAAADPTLPIAPNADQEPPLERLTKLMQLKSAQLISDQEFEEHRKRILESV